MKYGKIVLALCLICVLLLTGCNKHPAETPQMPEGAETPMVPAPPGSQGPSQPVTEPETPAPLQPPLTEEEEALLEAALLREEMAQLAERALAEGVSVLQAEQLEDDRWRLWCMAVKNGIRSVWTHTAVIAPDGKDFTVTLEGPSDESPAWAVIQNYRLLESDLTHSTGQMLENLGFDTEYTGNVPEPTDILFTDFQAAMLRIITTELYDSRFAPLFSEKDGKLQYIEAGATGALYLVDRAQQLEDGSWLAYEHTYHLDGNREDYTARVTLEELPDGRLAVASWEPTEN